MAYAFEVSFFPTEFFYYFGIKTRRGKCLILPHDSYGPAKTLDKQVAKLLPRNIEYVFGFSGTLVAVRKLLIFLIKEIL